jgi:translin
MTSGSSDLSGLDDVRDAVTDVLDAKHAAREAGLRDCRRVIRASANAIRSLHRGESEAAAELMAEAKERLDHAMDVLTDHPDVLHAGFVRDAAKEYAEARLTAALSAGDEIPLPGEVGVDVNAYLNGLGEAVGELRRRMLDLLRAEELGIAESTLEAMDAIVELLASLDYPDGMTGGLRRTTDVARALVERSRSDLTTTVVQERLRRDLQG